MKIPILLVATATKWPGTARIPRALSRAGFTVSLLTPRRSLAEKSEYVTSIAYLEDGATTREWVYAFAACVAATDPRLVVPCDDMALRLLQMLVLDPPSQLQASLQLRLAALVRESLGDPAHYLATEDKTLLPQAANAIGLPVPAWSIGYDVDEIAGFATFHGWPIVVKRAHGFAGRGVAICADPSAVARALATFAEDERKERLVPGDAPVPFLAQPYIAGPTHYYVGVAWRGRLLAGYAGEKMVAHPEPNGPPTVARYFRSPRLRAMTEHCLSAFGISGFFVVEFRIDAGTGDAFVLEITRRMSPVTHRSAERNVDNCAALYAALTGTASPSRADLDEGEEGIVVLFPGEFLRDPQSDWLRHYPVDVPWDEPELVTALMDLRHE